MTIADWIAVAAIALPLIVKAFSDWQANAIANHNAALSRIVGMAGREAANIARALTALPPGADAKAVESAMINASAGAILTEMGSSSDTINADTDKLTSIVQGELNRVLTTQNKPPVVVPPEPVSPPPTTELSS